MRDDPRNTQQYPDDAELVTEERLELNPLVDDDEPPTHLFEQTGSESVHEGPLRQVFDVPTVTQQYPEKEDVDDDEPKLHFD